MGAFRVCIIVILLSSACWAGNKKADLILVAGQSNAVGFDTSPDQLPKNSGDKKVMFWCCCGDPPADDFDTSSGQQWTTLQIQPKGTPKKKVEDSMVISETPKVVLVQKWIWPELCSKGNPISL